MKKTITLLLFIITNIAIYAQVGIGTTTPDPSSILDLSSTSKGVLLPRMKKNERESIVSPAKGLLVYQKNQISGFYYYDGSKWVLLGGDPDWTINGNDIYNANTGNVGIGNTAPTTKLHISGTTTLPSGGGGAPGTPLYSEDFEGESIGSVTFTETTTDIYQDGSQSLSSDYWRVSNTSNSFTCTNCNGKWSSFPIPSVSVSDMFLSTANFTPFSSSTQLDISFDYMFETQFADIDVEDQNFEVYLYNETEDENVITLVAHQQVNGSDFWDTNYNGSFMFDSTHLSTHTYSLRFRFFSTYGLGASIDNIVVTQDGSGIVVPGSYVFRLEDGTEGAGKVLTSDADGNATWQTPSSSRFSGKISSDSTGELTNKLDNEFKQKTNASILKQQTEIKELELEFSELKNMVNTLISVQK
jgi:hypothetical protein